MAWTKYDEEVNNEFEEWYATQPFTPGQDGRIKERARAAWKEQQSRVQENWERLKNRVSNLENGVSDAGI